MDSWLTTILIVLPMAGALLVAVAPLSAYWIGSLATLISLVEIGFWITAASKFDFSSPALQFSQQHSWLRDLNVSYHVGQYAFSLWLVGATVVVMAAAVIYGWWVGRERARAYFALMLFTTGAIVGVFTAQDLLLFYAFFEAMLIPLYVLLGAWGGADRLRATLTFVIYTVVGSLLMLAGRAPDLRGVVLYSSMSQSGLIVLGLFAFNDLGLDGAVLQMVNHALISASLFLIAGMVERRTSTGEFALLGGMARGRPALATVIMTAGIIGLAVPLSTAFAGEFLILAGAFQQGWAWAVVGAAAIVLAAMYMLRAISGVLHKDVGPAVPESALDLRLGELAVVVPLLLCLIGLSAWPNLISGHAFGGNQAHVTISQGLQK